MECRNPPEAAIPDAPAAIPGYVAFSGSLLGVIILERALDTEEWECVERL
jgi:hypothetical protein